MIGDDVDPVAPAVSFFLKILASCDGRIWSYRVGGFSSFELAV